jgi:ribonuclease VapC
MVIDSSALIAILLVEPEAEIFSRAIDEADEAVISSGNLLECSIVMRNKNVDIGEDMLDAFMRESGITIEPFTEEQTKIARRAYSRYGKGHHSAKLNFGDCIAYALAKDTGEPLLYKGTDFDKTDIDVVTF